MQLHSHPSCSLSLHNYQVEAVTSGQARPAPFLFSTTTHQSYLKKCADYHIPRTRLRLRPLQHRRHTHPTSRDAMSVLRRAPSRRTGANRDSTTLARGVGRIPHLCGGEILLALFVLSWRLVRNLLSVCLYVCEQHNIRPPATHPQAFLHLHQRHGTKSPYAPPHPPTKKKEGDG